MFTDAMVEQARALFPYTRSGRIYLNHAGTSPLPTRVVEAVRQHLLDRSEGALDTYATDLELVKRARASVAALINAESPSRIAFQSNTSDALNIVAAGLPWREGDRVILNDQEFPANVYPYLNVKRLGVELDFVGSHKGMVLPEEIERAITLRTRLVALSAVQFLSGHRSDLAAIGGICRARGIQFIVDGIQAVGAVAIDVRAMRIDALAAGAQKWQMGPHGTGFLYLTEELQEIIRQQYLGWLSVHDPWEFRNYTQPLASSARRFEGGSPNLPGLRGYDAALSVLLEFGTRSIEGRILELTGHLHAHLASIPRAEVITPAAPEHRAGIVTLRLPPSADGTRVFAKMQERGLTAALREGKIRYSPHFYNTPEEMAAAAEITRSCLRDP
jgi:selenocysteine lyase/cysteine desulfurase